jgi:hypothetical protein
LHDSTHIPFGDGGCHLSGDGFDQVGLSDGHNLTSYDEQLLQLWELQWLQVEPEPLTFFSAPATPKTENNWESFLLPHLGQVNCLYSSSLRTSSSKMNWQELQQNSRIGITNYNSDTSECQANVLFGSIKILCKFAIGL